MQGWQGVQSRDWCFEFHMQAVAKGHGELNELFARASLSIPAMRCKRPYGGLIVSLWTACIFVNVRTCSCVGTCPGCNVAVPAQDASRYEILQKTEFLDGTIVRG